VAAGSGQLQRGEAGAVGAVKAQAEATEGAHQELEHRPVAARRRPHHRAVARGVGGFGVAAELHQQLHGVQVTSFACQAEGRAAALVPQVHGRTLLEQ
jgi:hypothetical protein